MQQTALNDGLVYIYAVENAAENGDTPLETMPALPKEKLCYAQRTVGVTRHYAALQAKERVDLLIRVPFRPGVSTDDVAIPTLDRKQYLIKLIQPVEGSAPPLMDLTLRRLEHEYQRSDTEA